MSHEVQSVNARNESEEAISIVSFDGDGPGTISQLFTIKEYMGRLEYDLEAEEDSLVPADYFDFMGGVGFGGVCALFLGHLRMRVEEAMAELARVTAATFPCETDEMTTPEVNMSKLRAAVEDVLQRRGLPTDVKLKDQALQAPNCKVVTFAATTDTRDHCHSFRTYRSRYPGPDCTFVDAICATLATPNFFTPVSIGPPWAKQMFVGTPLGFNNPTRQVLDEALSHFGSEKRVSVVLSLGSGKPAVLSSSMRMPSRDDRNLLAMVVSDCERVAREISSQLHGHEAYLRLNVDQGMENLNLFDWHRLGPIVSHTHVYLQKTATRSEIDSSSKLLQGKRGSTTLGQLSRTSIAVVAKWVSLYVCHPPILNPFDKRFNPQQYGHHLALSPTSIRQIGDIVRGGVKGITLVDAIGNFIPISLELCRTYTMLNEVIGAYFRNQRPPGSDLVQRGDYRLVCGEGRSTIEPERWTYTVNAGLTVEMSMVLRKRNEKGMNCPRCQVECREEPQNGWANCSNSSCSGQFQVEDKPAERIKEEEFEVLISPASQPQSTGGASVSQARVVEKKNSQEDQRNQFRLISVINLLDGVAVARNDFDPNEDADSRLYCICRETSFGQMIRCDDSECEYEWFHLPCLGISGTPPQGDFVCPVCRARRNRRAGQKKKRSFISEGGRPRQKRRKYDEEIGRRYQCGFNGCTKAYGTLNHLNDHVSLQGHGAKRRDHEFQEPPLSPNKAGSGNYVSQLQQDGRPSDPHHSKWSFNGEGSGSNHHLTALAPMTCANCGTDTTPLWRRNGAGDNICNKCGLYAKARGMARPVVENAKATDEQTSHARSPRQSPEPHGGGPNGAVLGPGMPPAMVGQLRELAQTHMRTQPTPTHQTDQQYFTQMQQTAVNTYNIKPTFPATPNPGATGWDGAPTETFVTIATNPAFPAFPAPSSWTNHPTPGAANDTPRKNTLVTRGVSPGSVRHSGRPIPGLTPAPIPSTASATGGGQTSILAPSPSQTTTSQWISRSQTQSPSSPALARSSAANSNGAASHPSETPARYSGSGPSNRAHGGPGRGVSNPTTSNSMGSPTGMLGATGSHNGEPSHNFDAESFLTSVSVDINSPEDLAAMNAFLLALGRDVTSRSPPQQTPLHPLLQPRRSHDYRPHEPWFNDDGPAQMNGTQRR